MPWRTATSTPRPATALHRPSCLDRAVSSPRAGLPGRRRRGRLHRALLLLEAKHLPVYYFPAQDVRTELLEPSDTRTHFPYKGDACYWSVRVGKRVARDAVWSYQDPPGRAHRHQGLSSRVLDPDGCLVRRGRRGFVHPTTRVTGWTCSAAPGTWPARRWGTTSSRSRAPLATMRPWRCGWPHGARRSRLRATLNVSYTRWWLPLPTASAGGCVSSSQRDSRQGNRPA